MFATNLPSALGGLGPISLDLGPEVGLGTTSLHPSGVVGILPVLYVMRGCGQGYQVLRTVIERIAVDVVYVLAWLKALVIRVLPYLSMFWNVASLVRQVMAWKIQVLTATNNLLPTAPSRVLLACQQARMMAVDKPDRVPTVLISGAARNRRDGRCTATPAFAEPVRSFPSWRWLDRMINMSRVVMRQVSDRFCPVLMVRQLS